MNVNGTAQKIANGPVYTGTRGVLCAVTQRETTSKTEQGMGTWGVGQDRPHPMVASACTALVREGLAFREFPVMGNRLPCQWAKAVAECLARGECRRAVLFCEDPGLVSCVANKLPGLRAVAVTTVGQAARATRSLAANLLVVEMPGRTFFEIRQMLRATFAGGAVCPDGVACTLQELDGHAHR
jgi:hypothetical protein